MRSDRYVQQAADGGWDVVKEGHVRATAHGVTKQDAVRTARELVRQEGGGEVLVLNRSGKVVESDRIKRRRSRAAA
ncbi:MAG TPA: DUF2188 domain-containing protein [Solirubrobacterales bacterium]|nr:DUF2188 domain-containing protein [Solirubrobacterales bacterium]